MNQTLYLKTKGMHYENLLVSINRRNLWKSLAYISIYYSEIINLNDCNYILYIYPYGFLILIIKTIINPDLITYHLDVKTINTRALSLYCWCGYEIIRQRANLYLKIDGLHLINNNNRTANMQRRLLILR